MAAENKDDILKTDSDYLESTPEDSSLRTPSMEFKGHVGVVVSADWMTEGNQVITASWDRTAILHDTETGEQVSTLTGTACLCDKS